MDERARQDLADVVLGDLKWLGEADLTQGDESLLRELSARLRRLLVEGNLQLFRKHVRGLRGELSIEAPPPAEPPASDVTYGQAGGGERGGMIVEGVTIWNRALTPEEINGRYDAGLKARSEPRPLHLSAWLDETCIHVAGVVASRREVIKFVANKLGGVHLDPRRDGTKFPAYGALDQARDSLRVADLDAVYHELSSIGQQIAGAKDVADLLE